MSHSRQLAAIMFADIVGYTALMQEDEQLAMQLRDKMKQKLDAEISLHKKKFNKQPGRAINGNLEMHNLTTCRVAIKEK